MLLFDIGAILFCIGLMLNICFRIFPPKYVRDLNKTQKTGCFVLLTILSMIGNDYCPLCCGGHPPSY